MIPQIHIEDFSYNLPDERIAKYPLDERDASKLLLYRGGEVSQDIFRNLPSHLPQDAMMVFNDTKVVPARLIFRRQSGARIEVFCLKPEEPSDYALVFLQSRSCRWHCVIGNAKKWKDDVLFFDAPQGCAAARMELQARLISREGQTGVVQFSWNTGETFGKVLETCGQVPIPPYLNRKTEEIDLERYQTLYAHIRGSVAAPTAGLHFTPNVLKDIADKGIQTRNVCLHVGAGTFLPVKNSLVSQHTMHQEPFVVRRDFLQEIARPDRKRTIAVGTTSVRTLESLYYCGVSCIENGHPEEVEQWAPYTREYPYSTSEALQAIVDYLDRNGLDELKTGTRKIIVPGFKFRLVDMMVTNFHQPQSTLLLLISAFVGGDDWHKIYDYALENGFRFLSYGDSSLLARGQQDSI